MSYAELDRLAGGVAGALAREGLFAGDRVATTLGPGIEFVSLLHATTRLGIALVPLNPSLPFSEHERLARLAGAALIGDLHLEPGTPPDIPASLDPDAVHSVIFTSGTTAEPRPVELTNANHAASAAASAWNLGVAPDDHWLCVLPLFHVGGLSILLRSVIYGTTAVLHEGFDPDRVASEIAGGQITLASLVPTMLRRLRDSGLTRAPALRAILLGGGPIPADLLDWARDAGLPVAPTYGMTETASQIATADPVQALKGITGARPLQGADIQIAADGEILVRGAMVSAGALADDGWLHTGDLGTLEDGSLHVTGRLKDVIVSGGENVTPAEVEEALLRHPAVVDAGVVGLPDPEWGEAVTAFVLAWEVTEEDLIEHCREHLAPFKVPKRVEFVDSLPRNAAGKLVRSEIGRPTP